MLNTFLQGSYKLCTEVPGCDPEHMSDEQSTERQLYSHY